MKVTIHSQGLYICRMISNAVAMCDQMVWGGRMSEKIDEVVVMVDSAGVETDCDLLRGLADVYDPKTRVATLHCRGLLEQGEINEYNLAWAVAHDLTHAFDVAHGNLRLDRETETLTFMGQTYALRKKATTRIDDPEFSHSHRAPYYMYHQYYEPWEVRPLMMADAVSSWMRGHKKCPNLEGKYAA